MTQCPICGQELSEQSSRCETCERWAAGVATPPASDRFGDLHLVDVSSVDELSVDEPVNDDLFADRPLVDLGPAVATSPVVPAAAPSVTVAAVKAVPGKAAKRQLIWVLVIIVAAAAVTFAALIGPTEPAPDAVAAAPSAAPRTPSRSPAAAAKSAPVVTRTQRWTSEHRAKWLADTPGAAAFELPAEQAVQIWMRSVRPALVVRCAGGKMEAFVFTHSALAIEPQTEDHGVTVAIDDEAPRSERWADSQDHDALFAPDGKALAQRLVHAQTLRVGYTPHNAAPVTAQFAVAGLNELITSSAKPCGWQK